MPTIGGITVDTMLGEVDTLKNRFQDITRPRVDGAAVRENAKRADPTVLTTTTLAEAVNYAATKASYEALIGTLVTIEKADGQTYNNVLVLRVDTMRQDIANSTTAGADILITARFQVRDTNI